MKLIINIDEAIYEEAKNNWNYLPLFHCEEIWKATADGAPIPDDATNGDMIKAMFPNIDFAEMAITVHASTKVTSNGVKGSISYDFWKDWWNAPYKGEYE